MAKKKIELDPFQKYLEDHPEVYEQYKNKHVAIHPQKGIIASGDNFTEVHQKVKDQNLLEEVVFDIFNEFPFIGMGAYTFSIPEE